MEGCSRLNAAEAARNAARSWGERTPAGHRGLRSAVAASRSPDSNSKARRRPGRSRKRTGRPAARRRWGTACRRASRSIRRSLVGLAHLTHSACGSRANRLASKTASRRDRRPSGSTRRARASPPDLDGLCSRRSSEKGQAWPSAPRRTVGLARRGRLPSNPGVPMSGRSSPPSPALTPGRGDAAEARWSRGGAVARLRAEEHRRLSGARGRFRAR